MRGEFMFNSPEICNIAYIARISNELFFDRKQEKVLTKLQSSEQEHRIHPRKMSHCPPHPNIQDPNTLGLHHTKSSVLKGLFFHKTLHWLSSIQLFHLNDIKTLWEQQLQSPHFFLRRTIGFLGAGTMQIRQASFHSVINMQRQPAFSVGCEEPPTSFSKPRGFYNYLHCLFLNRRLHNNTKCCSSNLPVFCK